MNFQMPEFIDLPRGLPGTASNTGDAPRALWLSPEILAENPFWKYTSTKIFLGASGNQLVGIDDNRHLLTIAGSRSGKGVSVIVPNLLLYPGSVLVLDPKGENASLTAERRGKGIGIKAGGMDQEVFVIDPFCIAEVHDSYRAGFNPLSDLDSADQYFIDECDSIADALIV